MKRVAFTGSILFLSAFCLIACLAAPQPPVAAPGKDAGAPADAARLRELRIKARNEKLTAQEQAELDQGLKAREWANRPKLPPPAVPGRNEAPPQHYFVDNERGDDKANGLAAKPDSPQGGPVKTLARGVSLLKPGDTLHLAANAAPYRESLILNDVSGNADQPITIDGHGAAITGCDPLRADWVEAGAAGLYKSDKLLSQLEEFGDDAKLMRVFFLFDGVQQRMGRTSKGKKAGFKRPADLKPGEWTYEAATQTFYVKVAGKLANAKVEAPYRRNGVAIRGRAGVSHVVIRNLVCRHVLNDGFNLHGVGAGIRFENIGAFENGDDGFSPHETIECSINGYWACRNSTGIGLGNLAVTKISNAHLEGNFAYDFAMGHAPVTELSNSVIVTTEPDAKPLGTINPQDLKLTFDNVEIRAAGRGNVELAARSTFTARRLTAIVPTWEIAGVANVTESVIGGRAVECKPGGLWKGRNNVYGIETRLIGIEEPDRIQKDLTPDLFKAKGQPFPSAGADPSAMKIPPCPWGRTNRTGEKPSRAIQIEVLAAQEHLGHNITARGVHTVWCDGCRARLADSGDPFVIYWINNQIKNTPFRFREGRKYTVWFTGELGSGVMGYQGKCIDIGQVVKVEEK